MALIYLGVLGLEYAIAAGALAYGIEHANHNHPDSGTADDDQNPDTNPDSGLAPDDDSPGNPDGGVVPGSEVVFHHLGAGPYHTQESLIALEARRQWALLRRAWIRTSRHIPWMSITSIIGVYRGYHIFLSIREAMALRRATIALAQGRRVPTDTPLPVRKMMYLARVGINQNVRRGIKRVAGRDPFETPPPS